MHGCLYAVTLQHLCEVGQAEHETGPRSCSELHSWPSEDMYPVQYCNDYKWLLTLNLLETNTLFVYDIQLLKTAVQAMSLMIYFQIIAQLLLLILIISPFKLLK